MFTKDEDEKMEIQTYAKTPMSNHLINGYNTKNLDKAAYLLCRGARFIRVEPDGDGPIVTVIMDAVNKNHVKDFWAPEMSLEFWQWKNNRDFIKNQIKAKP